MAKITLFLILAAVVAVQGVPVGEGDLDISRAAAAGNWDLVHKLIGQRFNDNTIWQFPPNGASVRYLTPAPGGQVYGEAQYSFHQSSNVNGQKIENSGGHKIINDNGKISEFDFTP